MFNDSFRRQSYAAIHSGRWYLPRCRKSLNRACRARSSEGQGARAPPEPLSRAACRRRDIGLHIWPSSSGGRQPSWPSSSSWRASWPASLFRSFHGLHGLHRLGLLVVHCFRPTRLSRAAGLSVSVGLRFGWGGSFRRHGFHRHGFASTQKTRRGAACIDRGPLRSILYGGLP